ncbi:uncharacterized protein FTJAE_14082 [Fusarium tjaetaba]|uniref:Uncharacterized protein n=1 Tax=Fusarium tjaetaba TaxID=1567544 RepID=A0A8H5V617_9HYPO|nr:uncharacterized protein FTJAE_14082 [Fusarium tjaetaba]KAF5612362.1 hypothetical protein FTJAE_14082 [Fusarium tjaetaba]
MCKFNPGTLCGRTQNYYIMNHRRPLYLCPQTEQQILQVVKEKPTISKQEIAKECGFDFDCYWGMKFEYALKKLFSKNRATDSELLTDLHVDMSERFYGLHRLILHSYQPLSTIRDGRLVMLRNDSYTHGSKSIAAEREAKEDGLDLVPHIKAHNKLRDSCILYYD